MDKEDTPNRDCGHRDTFWDIYLKHSNYGSRLFNLFTKTAPYFISYTFDRESLPLPKEYGKMEYITCAAPPGCKQEICDFLMKYFSIKYKQKTGETPLLYFTVDTLFENDDKDHLFLIRHETNGIIATVRYHWIGHFMGLTSPSSTPDIYLVDALCVHPNWRGKKLVEYLLTTLHNFANKRNIPHAIFLHEGSSRFGHFPTSIHISDYVYRNLSNNYPITFHPSTSIRVVSQEMALRWIKNYLQFYPNTVFIGHPHCKNIKWVFYQNGSYCILAGIQNTHQIFSNTNDTMGWITAWFQYGSTTDDIRKNASIEITEYIKKDFDWIWMDIIWAGGDKKSDLWIKDGYFRWYNYQWDSHMSRNSYGILI